MRSAISTRNIGFTLTWKSSEHNCSGLLKQASEVYARFRQIGFTFVAMDLAGYRRGSLNEGQALIQIAIQ